MKVHRKAMFLFYSEFVLTHFWVILTCVSDLGCFKVSICLEPIRYIKKITVSNHFYSKVIPQQSFTLLLLKLHSIQIHIFSPVEILVVCSSIYVHKVNKFIKYIFIFIKQSSNCQSIPYI